MSLDELRCSSCNATGIEYGGGPCGRCAGSGNLDRQLVALDIARRHGTTAAAEFTGLSADSVRRLRRAHDPSGRGAGRPSRTELDALRPKITCPCLLCERHRGRVRYSESLLDNLIAAASERTPEDQDWRDRAACKGADPGIFFPERGGSLAEARSYCQRCPVAEECRTVGLGEHYGVWGGLSERQRRRQRPGRNLRDVG